MIFVFHGDNEPALHGELFKYIQTAKDRGVEVIRLDAKKIDVPILETAVGTDALFASDKLVVIDGLFSLLKSKRKDELMNWLKEHDAPTLSLFLTEKKTLTATQIKIFPSAQVKVFKYPAILFQWLESIGTVPPVRIIEMFHAVLEREDAQLCFIMLIRQVRTLVAYVVDGTFDGPPFLRGKIASQARQFSKEKILALHSTLLEIDLAQKTSRNVLSLDQNLDLILAEL